MVQTRQRSIFVTTIAWVFIALSGFGVLVAILQNIMYFTVFDNPAFKLAAQTQDAPDLPFLAGFMIRHMHLFVVAFLLVAVIALVSSIGLLKRWNWARWCFAGIMVLGIVWNLLGLVQQFGVYRLMRQQFADMSAMGASDMQWVAIVSMVVGSAFAIGLCVLLGWIVRRLLSREVAAEFVAGL